MNLHPSAGRWPRHAGSLVTCGLLLLGTGIAGCSGRSTTNPAPSPSGQSGNPDQSDDVPAEGFACLLDECTPVSSRPKPVGRPACPEGKPDAGADCSNDGLKCSYGESQASYCRDFMVCSAGQWSDTSEPKATCLTQPNEFCPVKPSLGAACTVGATSVYVPCEYEAGVLCYCLGNPVGKPGARGQWDCYGPPSSPRCPEALPNLGDGCAETGITCHYGVKSQGCYAPYADVYCYQGAWEASSPICPL
jgi:hypothetical protein